MYIVFTFNLSLPLGSERGYVGNFGAKLRGFIHLQGPCARKSLGFSFYLGFCPFPWVICQGKPLSYSCRAKGRETERLSTMGGRIWGKWRNCTKKMQIFPKTARKRCRILRNLHEFDAILVNFGKSRWLWNSYFLTSSMRHPEPPDWINLFISVLRALFFQH